jgi:hypothetical protein
VELIVRHHRLETYDKVCMRLVRTNMTLTPLQHCRHAAADACAQRAAASVTIARLMIARRVAFVQRRARARSRRARMQRRILMLFQDERTRMLAKETAARSGGGAVGEAQLREVRCATTWPLRLWHRGVLCTCDYVVLVYIPHRSGNLDAVDEACNSATITSRVSSVRIAMQMYEALGKLQEEVDELRERLGHSASHAPAHGGAKLPPLLESLASLSPRLRPAAGARQHVLRERTSKEQSQ